MKTSFAYSGVAIVMFATGLSAQTQAPSNQGSSSAAALVTVGCVNRALPTGSLAPAPGVSSAPPTAAPMVANASEPTSAFLLAGATPPNAAAEARTKAAAGQPVVSSPATYVLDGMRGEVEKHLGHLVEVTGTLKTMTEGTQANKTTINHLQVASVKMLAPACAQPKVAAPK